MTVSPSELDVGSKYHLFLSFHSQGLCTNNIYFVSFFLSVFVKFKYKSGIVEGEIKKVLNGNAYIIKSDAVDNKDKETREFIHSIFLSRFYHECAKTQLLCFVPKGVNLDQITEVIR